jgi:amino-acid N-acetyltransferase
VRDFTVFVDGKSQEIKGCCALQFCWDDLAEIRSLAVHPEQLRKGIGSKLVEHVLFEAKSFEIQKVFALTYRPDFFKRFGFQAIDRAELPIKIWADCIMCIKFPDCDETAMMKIIGPGLAQK